MKANEVTDAKIRAALQPIGPNDCDFTFDEQSLIAQARQIFRGRNRWINSMMVVCSLLCLALMAYAAYRFYWAVQVKELIAWSVAFSAAMLAISIMKIWAWLEMEKYSTMREIKRLELRVAMLVEKRGEI